MKYAMLVYLDEAQFYGLSKEEQNRVHQECTAWHDALVASGKSIGATGLQPAAKAKRLRAHNGKPVITDGPFAESKEVVGGFEMLECANDDEAVAICQRFPGLRVGISLELRPLVVTKCGED